MSQPPSFDKPDAARPAGPGNADAGLTGARNAGRPGPPPGPPFAPARAPRRVVPVAAVLGVLGLVTTAVGAFALPLNQYGSNAEYGYVNIRSLAALAAGHPGPANHPLFSGLATFWWRFGLFIAGGLATALVCVLVLRPAARALGLLLAAVALVAGVLQAFALAQSADYLTAAVYFDGYDRANIFSRPGPGVWVSLAGFLVLLVAGVVGGALRARR